MDRNHDTHRGRSRVSRDVQESKRLRIVIPDLREWSDTRRLELYGFDENAFAIAGQAVTVIELEYLFLDAASIATPSSLDLSPGPNSPLGSRPTCTSSH